MRNLKEVYEDYEDDVAILGIDQDPSESESTIRRYVQSQGYTWDMAAYVGEVVFGYGIIQQAAAVAIDGNGVITYRKGYRDGTISARQWREILDDVKSR